MADRLRAATGLKIWSLGKFFRVGAGIATGYFLVEACEELSLWLTCRDLVTKAANANEELKQAISPAGDSKNTTTATHSISAGQYWDSSLRTTHQGNVLHCTIPVHGEAGSSDVNIKLVKAKNSLLSGYDWWPRGYYCPGENLLYNHLGSGEWKVLVHYAVIGETDSETKSFFLILTFILCFVFFFSFNFFFFFFFFPFLKGELEHFQSTSTC